MCLVWDSQSHNQLDPLMLDKLFNKLVMLLYLRIIVSCIDQLLMLMLLIINNSNLFLQEIYNQLNKYTKWLSHKLTVRFNLFIRYKFLSIKFNNLNWSNNKFSNIFLNKILNTMINLKTKEI
jgi:DNA integrity scanning protein DisA with diadenylate cyclase activity